MSLRAQFWAFNWKMLFNSDPNKPGKEILNIKEKGIDSSRVISLKHIQLVKGSFQNILISNPQ